MACNKADVGGRPPHLRLQHCAGDDVKSLIYRKICFDCGHPKELLCLDFKSQPR